MTVLNRQGLHARPAAMIAQLGRRFDAKIVLVREHERADCTDVLHVMSLGITPGQTLLLEATGLEAEEAAEALVRLITDELPRIED